MTWHADAEVLERYAVGDLDQARSFSIEAHLLECDACRRRVSFLADGDRLERMWNEVQHAVDAPRRGPVEALLVRLGTPDHLARLLAATPSLRLSWLAAVGLALSFSATAAHRGPGGLLFFLSIAPLLPLAGVAAAYGPSVDPTHEISVSSPMSTFRLLLVRATAVLATTTVLSGISALALPGLDWTAAAWLLPSLGLTLASLALGTVVPPLPATGAVVFAWLAVIVLGSGGLARPSFVIFQGAAQIIYLVMAVVAGLVIAWRRESFEMGRST